MNIAEIKTVNATETASIKEILEAVKALSALKKEERNKLMEIWKKAEAEYVQWRNTEYKPLRAELLAKIKKCSADKKLAREAKKAAKITEETDDEPKTEAAPEVTES